MTVKKQYENEAKKLRQRIKNFHKEYSPRGYGRDTKGKTYPQFLAKQSGVTLRTIRKLMSTSPTGYMSIPTYFLLRDSLNQIEQSYIQFIK